MAKNDITFYYFDLRARGEISRLILACGGKNYKDIRFNFEQWPEYKPKMILGQCPVLELENGLQLPQSLAVARYLARENNLAGKNNLESAQIDAVIDTQLDTYNKFLPQFFEEDETKKKEEMEKLLSVNMPILVENLQKLRQAYSGKNSKYFVGDSLTWADLFVFDSIQQLLHGLPGAKEKYADQFKEYLDPVTSDARLKEYLKSRPDFKVI
ncbi:unnamed protein product [Didymodactylos carnosus]|uniref:glutathione transferase n=1 Tax=Didymodactylos carnosus TaxID=1234261 RepID=A0A814U1P4_9BILA|nr:unnamed protein product [Didymodactylos carnosus]CAF1170254.1 unnamed protein product [Didymodactylos carnosus]CAF3705652.1 unnamed protein product [Didymodactylos carnosus]CAF3933996.1 unnamed protein product [Didymodactylos carnosus]